MQNKLIPITPCPESPGHFQPSLIPHGYQFRQLVRKAAKDGSSDGFVTKDDEQGFSFRNDLNGLVHKCGGLRIIEIDDGGIFAIQNPHPMLLPLV